MTRFKLLSLFLGLICLTSTLGLSAAPALPVEPPVSPVLPGEASPNLKWWPYLQQLSSTGVVLLWTTSTGGSPSVRFSAAGGPEQTVAGTSRELLALGTTMHRVELTGLQPNTRYSYGVLLDGAELLPGIPLTFRTAPPTGSTEPFTFLAFGDYGYTSSSQEDLRDQMERDSFDLILTTGDNAYTDATYADFDVKVFGIYKTVFARAGLFPSSGNHEYHTDNAAPYLDIFDLPQQAMRPADNERYYAFDYGNVHFVVLDTEQPLVAADDTATDDQLDWLRADLAATTQPWKVAVFHEPVYTTGTFHGPDLRAREKLVPILEQYGVQLVLNGHEHLYQRTKPLLGGQVTTEDAGGITYIVSGAGWKAKYGCGHASYIAAWVCDRDYGVYNRISVSGSCMVIQAVRETGELKDNYQRCLQPQAAPSATPDPQATPSATSSATPDPQATPSATPRPPAPLQPYRLWMPVQSVVGSR